jgi:hypothetical protein
VSQEANFLKDWFSAKEEGIHRVIPGETDLANIYHTYPEMSSLSFDYIKRACSNYKQ